MDNRALGLLEIIAQMGTGGAAEMGGGLAYLGTLPFGGDPAAQAVKNAVQDRFTYQPRTQSARSMMQMVSEYGAPFMQKAGQKLDETADAVYQRTGSPTLGAAVKTAPTALMELSDRINVGGMLKRNKSILDMTAYHGSPHDFDEFSLSRIGTGEGAQAYGHGLYFAENPEVAGIYRAAGGYLSDDASKLAADTVASMGGEKRALDHLTHILPPEGETTFSGQNRDLIQKAINAVRSGEYKPNAGRLYTVDIPDDAVAKFLDWDKPLSQQPQAVRDALLKWFDEQKTYPGGYSFGEHSGETLYRALEGRGMSKPDVSKLFSGLGIPGIRYLDAGSRSGGNGTSNFVVFDDKLVKVLKKE